jgi:ABC-2 type transport system ATP-binding protein
MSPSPAVEVIDLVKRYAGRPAVDRLSLVVEVGSVTAVLGPNGAGKTTTLETCEGYRRPDAGLVRVLGRDPWHGGRELRARVGVMLQAGGVYPGVSSVEMLRHVASLYAHPLEVAGLVERLGLGSNGRTPFRRLSGGQQQRLSLALAVVGRPELVFLDEPTAGLDPQARRATWELVEEMRSDGVTVVLSTHHMDEAERLADQVVVVDHGRVVAAGTPAELTADGASAADGTGDPGSPTGSLRFSARPGLDVASLAAAAPAASRVEELSPGRYAVHGAVGAQLLADVTAWCAARDVMPEGLSVGKRTLEDVFLELTGTELR